MPSEGGTVVYRKAHPDIIPAGFDFLQTVPEHAIFRFNVIPIPEGFFKENSRPLAIVVRFRGRPLSPSYFGGLAITHVDTIIERKASANLSPPYPCSQTLPIEIVALALEGVNPIEVKVGKHSELWNIEAGLSPSRPSVGEMTITKTNSEGGRFDSALTIFPLLRFIRRCDGNEKVIDVGSLPLDDDIVSMLTIHSRETPWRHAAENVLTIEGLNDNFIAGAPGIIEHDGESTTHDVSEPPSCDVVIGDAPTCLCLGKTRQYTAQGSPSGGTFTWTIRRGAGRASIVSGGNQQTVTVRGDTTSGSAGDITLEVEYVPPGGGTSCSDVIQLTTVDARLELRTSGSFDSLNGVGQIPPLGHPQLGPVSPGNPPPCVGFFKNVEVEAKIFPSDPNLPCRFAFRRTREGTVGFLFPGGFFSPDPPNCPVGPCDDSPTPAEQDLTLSPIGTIYNIDSPGSFPVPCVENQLDVNCLNFTEWLEVDNQQCGPDLAWHAETLLQCHNGTWTEIRGSVGPGHIECLGIVQIAQPRLPLNVALTARMIESDSLEDRVSASHDVNQAQQRNQIDDQDRADLIQQLMGSAARNSNQEEFASSLMMDLQLLAVLRAEEAIPLFLEHALREFQRPAIGAQGTVAASALESLGNASVGPIAERASYASDQEWQALEKILQTEADQRFVQRTVCATLDSRPVDIAEVRLDRVMRNSEAALQQATVTSKVGADRPTE
jgi:hypothetical protein